MYGRVQSAELTVTTLGGTAMAALALVLMLALLAMFAQPAQAQAFHVLYNLGPQGGNGYLPYAGVTADNAGNLYGTTAYGGVSGCGSVFQLKHVGNGWLYNPLYSFAGGRDGSFPPDRVIFGPDGTLYGTSSGWGGGACASDVGTVFTLQPPPTACKAALCPWNETVIYHEGPGTGDLIFDRAGNIYGTGVEWVYELTPSNGGWKDNVIYWFPEGTFGGVALDEAGNLYGTTYSGGLYGSGVLYQLQPSASGWTETVLYDFQGQIDGATLYAGLAFDDSGALYGAAATGGSGGGGTVFQLTPSGDTWTLAVLYSFEKTGSYPYMYDQVSGPVSRLVIDASGNLYGTTYADGAYGHGSVFKLSRSGGGWTYTSLHDFCSGGEVCRDGAWPLGVTLAPNGNLYGTTFTGGAYSGGVVFEIVP